MLDLDYRCGDHKVVFFRSKQNYCALEAGDIVGSIYGGNELRVEYKITLGSYWDNQPGYIQWFIY